MPEAVKKEVLIRLPNDLMEAMKGFTIGLCTPTHPQVADKLGVLKDFMNS